MSGAISCEKKNISLEWGRLKKKGHDVLPFQKLITCAQTAMFVNMRPASTRKQSVTKGKDPIKPENKR